MMGAVRSWLLAVIAASLLCAVAGALMPPGGVKRVGRLVCGLVMLAAVLSPLAGPLGMRAPASAHRRETAVTASSQLRTAPIMGPPPRWRIPG